MFKKMLREITDRAAIRILLSKIPRPQETRPLCWECACGLVHAIEMHFCIQCGKIQLDPDCKIYREVV
jgi:hypothetical protein